MTDGSMATRESHAGQEEEKRRGGRAMTSTEKGGGAIAPTITATIVQLFYFFCAFYRGWTWIRLWWIRGRVSSGKMQQSQWFFAVGCGLCMVGREGCREEETQKSSRNSAVS